jgi:hypothetical protein
MSTLGRAVAIAATAHSGQLDKAGEPYILHPIRVMQRVSSPEERMAAILHDVVEDTPWTLEMLRPEGFPPAVLAAIDALTKRPGEDYRVYLGRVSRQRIARTVKLADLEDNLDIGRIARPTPNDLARHERNLRAKEFLLDADVRDRIRLLPEPRALTLREVEDAVPTGTVLACDFEVLGIHDEEELPWGYRCGRVESIDHHTPARRMKCRISSTNLALERVARCGPAADAETVVVNHTDCDSILSAGVVSGILPPDERFGRAAIAADHTGEEDDVADLLQALDRRRDPVLSFRALRRLLAGEPLDADVQAALDERRARRRLARELVRAGRFEEVGGVAWAELEGEVDGEFFPALLPTAAVIVLGSRDPSVAAPWITKVRLGQAAPEGLSLFDLGIRKLDPNFGGRWNAGSNRRLGGTKVPPDFYAEALAARLGRVE